MANKRYLIRQILLISLFVIVFAIAIFLLYGGLSNDRKMILKYTENNNINYKVYLKDNDFFDTPYIDQGKTYITSLIDYIHIDFNYNINFDNKVKSDLKYHIVATIESNKSDNEVGNYWTKNYNVTDIKEKNFKDVNNYSISESIDIDYNKYNEILNEFKKSMGLSDSAGVLKIYLEIDSNVEGNEVKKPIKSNMLLKLPLSQLAIEASIESNANNKANELVSIVRVNNPIYKVLLASSAVMFIISILLLVSSIKVRKKYRIKNEYDIKLKKILTAYDSIIVNVSALPDIKKCNLIEVESFNELIDAHSEIRMPINYYHEDKVSTFLLFNESTAWRYILKDSEKGSAKDEK